MGVIYYLNSIIVPFIVAFIIIFAFRKNIDIFNVFTEGAKDGIETSFKILPSLIGLICAVNVFKASGLLEASGILWKPFEKITSFPSELMPLAFAKTFSSSASTGVLMDLFKTYGPDSYIGITASIMMCCTETVFYTISVYFSGVKINDTRHILICTFIGIVFGIWASAVLGKIFMI